MVMGYLLGALSIVVLKKGMMFPIVLWCILLMAICFLPLPLSLVFGSAAVVSFPCTWAQMEVYAMIYAPEKSKSA